MKHKIISCLCLLLTAAFSLTAAEGVRYNLNVDWKFAIPEKRNFPLADALESMKKDGKQFYAIDYDDSGWETVSVPHPINAKDSFDDQHVDAGEANLYRGFMFYRKHFALDQAAAGQKIFIEFESVRQTIYLYVNGEFAGYYEAGVAPVGFDISRWAKAGDNLVAIATDNTANRGMKIIALETKPGNTPGDRSGTGWQWNQKDFNPVQGGLTGNVNLYVKSPVYLTLPLYNNLKTTGSYITASEFDFARGAAKIRVRGEVRNESAKSAKLTLGITVKDAATGKAVANFQSSKAETVAPAEDKGKVFQTALESDVYAENPRPTAVITPEVKTVLAEKVVSGLKFWSPDDPTLYRVEITLRDANGAICDCEEIVTGFRDVRFDAKQGLLINGKPFYLKGYAQRSTNSWAAIGVANDWLNDFEAAQVRESGANFIRWMHVAPKPVLIRAGDKYGVVSVAPAGDKEADVKGRTWAQRVEAMRDTMIYFRNSPSVIFWEAGNNAITAEHMQEMTTLKHQIDPAGGRFMGCRTLTSKEQIAAAEWVGTMIYRHDKAAKASMNAINRQLPMVETEYNRDESPRRVWDRYSPPDYDYVNKWLGGGRKRDGFDVWDQTQEDFCLAAGNLKGGYGYFYNNRVGSIGGNYYVGAGALVWADSSELGRNTGSENCRVSGRVDAVRIPKESFYVYQVFHSETPRIKILGHWNYPELTPETYQYRVKEKDEKEGYWRVSDKIAQRDPKSKTVYVIGSPHCASIELFINAKSAGVCSAAKEQYNYEFPGIDVTKSGEIRAVAKDAKGNIIADDKIETVGERAAIELVPVAGPEGLRADGSDVMFFDVRIVDAKGRVCPLDYERIDFQLAGPGVFLGGYNSGKFGKDAVIHKNYVFAECGLNRVFVRATRNAGEITLTATSGKLRVTASTRSVAVKAVNGFSPDQQANRPNQMTFGTQAVAVVETTAKPTTGVTESYKILVNGKAVDCGKNSPYKPDSSTGVVAPLRPVLAALKQAGASFELVYLGEEDVPAHLTDYAYPMLVIEANGKKAEIYNGNTEIILNDGEDKNLTNFEFTETNKELVGELAAVLEYVPGIEIKIDPAARTFVINIKK